MSAVQVGKIIEVIQHPFGKGALTTDGVQWSAEVTSAGVTYTTVENVIIDEIGSGGGPGAEGTLIELELGITWQQKSSGATYKAIGRLQGRNKGGTWVDLAEVTNTTAGTTYEGKTYSGRYATVTNFSKYPFELRVQVKSENVAENAIGQVKNSSYCSAKYKIA